MPIKEDENSLTSPGGKERNFRLPQAGASKFTASQDNLRPREQQLMEGVLTKANMIRAMKRVEQNEGAAGIDDMTVGELKNYLNKEWPRIKGELLEGRYKPKPVRRVVIPKAGGGERALGIPTVVDRLIQQAVHQVISPIFEKDFSESNYGYRPKRSAQQAVEAARRYVAEGRRWVVDIDLEKFFDRVNHDILMARVARKVKDKRILLLIRRYLQAGIMEDGLITASTEGAPQGGPLSPLLSNILLDDLDKELGSREHKFCGYADDCNIYVQTQRAGERVRESVTLFLAKKLKLKVNGAKSAVDRPWKRKFLGYTITNEKEPRLRASVQSITKLKDKLKAIFRRGRGRNMGRLIMEELNPVIRGWGNYFSLTRVKKIPEELDFWIRRKLRCILWRQMKRAKTRSKRMIQQGLNEERAWESATNGRGAWWNAGASHMNQAYPISYFNKLGLVNLMTKLGNS